MTVPTEGDFVWAMMKCENVSFMLQTFKSLGEEMPSIKREEGGSLLFYIQTKNIRDLYHSIKDKVSIVNPPLVF